MTITTTEPFLLKVGSAAPDFHEVLASGNQYLSLSDYKGQFLIMVFYPKDQTPGCTKQLCALRDDFEAVRSSNAQVVGVNHGSLQSHDRFVAAQDYPFPILVDEGGRIASVYGALKEGGGIQRTVYIISPEGKIAFAEQGMPSDEKLLETIRNYNA